MPTNTRGWRPDARVLVAISLGGMIGASARYALQLTWPHTGDAWPWATFVTNLSGCLLVGVLMVYVVEAGTAHPLARPFLGVGVLGGYTTFSTYTVETNGLFLDARPALALGYLFGTLVAAVAAVVLGVWAARTGLGVRRWLTRRKGDPR